MLNQFGSRSHLVGDEDDRGLFEVFLSFLGGDVSHSILGWIYEGGEGKSVVILFVCLQYPLP